MTNSKYVPRSIDYKVSTRMHHEFEFDLSFEDIAKSGSWDLTTWERRLSSMARAVPIDNLEQLQIGTSNAAFRPIELRISRLKARAARNVFPVNPRGRVNSQTIIF